MFSISQKWTCTMAPDADSTSTLGQPSPCCQLHCNILSLTHMRITINDDDDSKNADDDGSENNRDDKDNDKDRQQSDAAMILMILLEPPDVT